MKVMKLFSVACCVAAMSLTSCIGDDSSDYKPLTKNDIAMCLNAVRGTHQGKCIYLAPTAKDINNTDTVDISWTITTDSTMTIHDFPVKLLAQNIDSISGKEVRNALLNAGESDIECYIGFTALSPIQWLINPKSPEINITTSDGNHKIQIAFWGNHSYSSGAYSTTTKEMSMEIIEGLIFMDGKTTSYLTKDTPFLFRKNK